MLQIYRSISWKLRSMGTNRTPIAQALQSTRLRAAGGARAHATPGRPARIVERPLACWLATRERRSASSQLQLQLWVCVVRHAHANNASASASSWLCCAPSSKHGNGSRSRAACRARRYRRVAAHPAA
jgi:hypothetical protein